MVSVMRFDESSSLGLELDRMIGVGSVENESFVCNYDLPKVPLTRWKSSEIAALAPSSEGQSGVGAQLELDECDAQQNGLLLGEDFRIPSAALSAMDDSRANVECLFQKGMDRTAMDIDPEILAGSDSDADESAGPRNIGAYNPEARKERLEHFHRKRARRNWKKRITYACR